MNNPKKTSPPIGGTIVLILFIACILIVVTAFLNIGPFPELKAMFRQWGQDLQSRTQQMLSSTDTNSPLYTAPTQETAIQDGVITRTQTVGNWEYILNTTSWNKNVVTVNLSIRNDGNETVPFGFSYQVSDVTFASIYKLCAQNSNKQVFWDTSLNESGEGFYNRYFSPGETRKGELIFNIAQGSEKIYLCLSVGGNVANKLFYLGNPGEL